MLLISFGITSYNYNCHTEANLKDIDKLSLYIHQALI